MMKKIILMIALSGAAALRGGARISLGGLASCKKESPAATPTKASTPTKLNVEDRLREILRKMKSSASNRRGPAGDVPDSIIGWSAHPRAISVARHSTGGATPHSGAGETVDVSPGELKELIGTEFLSKDGHVGSDAIDGKYLGIYFSASWCGPCQEFTPKLVDAYNKLKADGKSLEVVLVSADEEEDDFEEYFAKMPWLAIPFNDDRQTSLSKALDVAGYPTFTILDPQMNIVTLDAVGAVFESGADKFPWTAKQGE